MMKNDIEECEDIDDRPHYWQKIKESPTEFGFFVIAVAFLMIAYFIVKLVIKIIL